jgi:hypothetical protein
MIFIQRIYVFLQIFLVIFALQLLLQKVSIVFVYVHMYFIDKPADKLVGVMMFVIVEKLISSPNPADESLVIDNPSSPFAAYHIFEEFMQFIEQIIFLLVAWLPQ